MSFHRAVILLGNKVNNSSATWENCLFLVTVKERIIAAYSLFLGVSVLGLWTLILITGEIPEGPLEFTFHLISEILMAKDR